MVTMKDFVCNCMGLYGDCTYLDDILDNFEFLDIDEEDIENIFRTHPRDMSNGIAHFLFKKIIDRAVEELKLDEGKFDTFINDSLDTHLYYDKAEIYSWNDLEEIQSKSNNN